jgi:hypothetical protein
MKRIKYYFFLVFVFNSFVVFGQKNFTDDINLKTDLESEYVWKANNLEWVLVNKSDYVYDETGRLIEIIKSELASGNPITKISYYYENEDLSAYEVYGWSGGAWRESTRYNYRYENGRKVEQIVQGWANGTWTNLKKDSDFNYNDSGLLTESINYRWKNGKWIKDYIITYDYNNESLMQSKTSIDLYGRFLSRVNYSYNAFNKYSRMYAEFWRNSQWENSWNRIYSYDNCGKIRSLDRQDWVNGIWVNSLRSVYTLSLNVNNLTNKKIPVCHNGNTIYVSINAVPAHLAHGDCIGECLLVKKPERRDIYDNENQKKPPFTIFPNPASERITIRFDSADYEDSKRVELTDFYGKLIKSFNIKDNSEFTIYRQNLPSGKYNVRLIGKEVYSAVVIFE